ncbi:MAG TPA: DUF3137 domain-containing protein [Allosphingosinicella sp.]|nr:DUF3137 domain-containing protein [Allosphingosinicella sp.]
MIELGEEQFNALCRAGPVSAELGALDDKRRGAVRHFWMSLIGGIVFAGATVAVFAGMDLLWLGLVLGVIVFAIGLALGMIPMGRVGGALKQPVLDTLAGQNGLTFMQTGFDPPVYPDARKALFGSWLSSQSFTDLFHGMDPEGKRFAFYEAYLARKSGKSTQVVFSGQVYAFQRRTRSGGEIVVVPDRGLFNFFKPVSGMERVRFESDPEFEKRFEVYAFHAHEALALIGSDVRRKLLALRQAGRVFAYVGPEDVLVAAGAKNKFEPGSMFRATAAEARVRTMFDDVGEALTHLRALKAALG